jgi:DNA-binding NarL/FixJ family response regulator
MRVLIADDHALFREGLSSLLGARGIEVVGEARTGREAVLMTRALRPDLVLMDLAMPEMDGLVATRIVSTELPDVKVVVLTGSEDDASLIEAVKSGAQGYLLKNVESEQLFTLLAGVLHGEPAFTPGLARKVLAEFARPAPSRERRSTSLTEREREVLNLLVRGVTSNRQLAERLTVSENTVKYHLRNILDKLHLENRAQVIAYALGHRLTYGPGPASPPLLG